MRNTLHIILSLAMWVVFGYYWYVVLGREVGTSTIRALLMLIAAVGGGLAVTVLWIGHNLRLARKFAGRRRGAPQTTVPTLIADTIGRPVEHPGLDVLRAAAIVDIDADEAIKRYRVTQVREAS